MRGYNNVIGSVAMRDKMIDIENAIKIANSDGVVTYEELRQDLKRYFNILFLYETFNI